jgi:D-alanyl-D-alanine carboxypeptidase
MFSGLRAVFGVIARKGTAAGLPLAMGLILAVTPGTASARRHHGHAISLTYPTKDAALIIDGETGKVLYARNANVRRYPASLTKLMTLYLLFDAMQKGRVSLQTPMVVSAHAARQSPVKLYMKPGDKITVQQAIKAIVVRSANDVAVVIAEKLGGSERHFARMMTAKARALGMRHTHYVNASGLPNRAQVTTASDLALLARHIAYDFPQFYHFFAAPSFTFHGHTWATHDNLIGNYKGADGMKTGYTVMSGFNLVSSVVRNGAHVIGIVMGGRSAHKRDREMVRLLNVTFSRISKHPTLVARAEVPWHTIAEGPKPNPIIAGFDIGSALAPRPKAQRTIASAAPELRPATAADPNDEDAAESRRDPDEDMIADMIAPKPSPRPKVTRVAYRPPADVPRPMARSAAIRSDSGVVPSPLASLGLSKWTIQIGAFADPKIARAQLAAYAERSMDILGQASRIVVPFQSVDGHTLYRARFGPFVEREARRVCERLTERGQTCFAAIATR